MVIELYIPGMVIELYTEYILLALMVMNIVYLISSVVGGDGIFLPLPTFPSQERWRERERERGKSLVCCISGIIVL